MKILYTTEGHNVTKLNLSDNYVQINDGLLTFCPVNFVIFKNKHLHEKGHVMRG